MERTHYIVRVGNAGLAPSITRESPNHWHYLSAQRLWGLPRELKQVKVRAKFMSDLSDPRVACYIWFLCNSHGGRGHFVAAGLGRPDSGHGPVANGNLPVPPDMLERLRQGFDHWFEWDPVSRDPAFAGQLAQLRVPVPHYISTLRRVTAQHQSFASFEALVDAEELRAREGGEGGGGGAVVAPQGPLPPPAPPMQALEQSVGRVRAETTASLVQADLSNLQREHTDPHAPGHVYLIHMQDTSFFKIGMSLDPATRLRTLQTGNPRPLRLLGVREVEDMLAAEARLHRRFDSQGVKDGGGREWFDFGEASSDLEADWVFRAL